MGIDAGKFGVPYYILCELLSKYRRLNYKEIKCEYIFGKEN